MRLVPTRSIALPCFEQGIEKGRFLQFDFRFDTQKTAGESRIGDETLGRLYQSYVGVIEVRRHYKNLSGYLENIEPKM